MNLLLKVNVVVTSSSESIVVLFILLRFICIYDSQREKAFLKIFRPDAFFSYLYKTLFYNFFYIVQSIKKNKLKSKLST